MADLGGGCRGCAPPWDDLRFSNTIGILPKKKTMWFIAVEVEPETSAPPPKKNPWSAPGSAGLIDLKESTWSNVTSAYLARTLGSTLEEAVWICFASGTVCLSTQTQRVQFWIDHFTDTAAILNLSNLGSIMGCPGGTRSVFSRAFRAKRELQCIFLGKKAIIITS